jgi:26S proteasome non-ATPase regulatory subunit 10
MGSNASKIITPHVGSLGNTPLHLAMDSAYAEAAVMLIEAGADRERVFPPPLQALFALPDNLNFYQLNHDQEAPEDVEGVGGPEQKRARDYIVAKCGKR